MMIMSAIMYLVPGIPFTTAARDTINGDYAAGSARMLECIVVALARGCGRGLWNGLLPDIMGRNAMMILQILSAFSAVLVFTMILEIPKKYMLYASASGAVGWWAYLMVQNSGHSSMLAAFLSTLVVAFLSHILARVKKARDSVSDTGTLPAVPGAAIYRSVYYFLQNDSALATKNLLETIQIAGAIAMGIFTMDSLFRLVLAYDRKKAEKG